MVIPPFPCLTPPTPSFLLLSVSNKGHLHISNQIACVVDLRGWRQPLFGNLKQKREVMLSLVLFFSVRIKLVFFFLLFAHFFSCLTERELCDGFSNNVPGWIRVFAARSGPSLRCTQVLVLKPAALVLFAVGNHIIPPPTPSLPCSGPSAPQLIPGSLHRYRSALASHQRAKKCSPPLVACQSLPLLLASTICCPFSSFFCLFVSHRLHALAF